MEQTKDEKERENLDLDSKITKPKDAFTISYNNDPNVLFWPVLQDIQHLTPVTCHNTISVDFIQGLLLRISKLLMRCICFNGGFICLLYSLSSHCHMPWPRRNILVFKGDINSMWTPKDAAKFLAGFPNSWSIHNWQQLLHMVNQHLVEKPLISFLQHQLMQPVNNISHIHQDFHSFQCPKVSKANYIYQDLHRFLSSYQCCATFSLSNIYQNLVLMQGAMRNQNEDFQE